LRQLQQFRLENLKIITFQPTKIEEFQLLNTSVEKLLQSNVDSYVSQKNFIENAAHELQTPLAISLNKLELLVEDNQLQPEQAEQIAGVMEHLERLTRLNKSLLLLSKIENKQFAELQKVNINAVVKKIIADFSDQAEFREVKISIQDHALCEQDLNADLANILLLNLIKNAIIHNHPGGEVIIMIDQQVVVIQNSGSDQALDKQKLFTRFHKNAHSPNSTGLGLAIVKAIVDLYHLELTYQYQQYHTWTIKF